MAENDAEIDIGIKIDESQLASEYNKFLTKLSDETKNFIQATLDDMKGAAAKSWATLPYFTMHSGQGNTAATQAFLPSFGADLAASGIAPNTPLYNSALMSASLRSSIPDPILRHNAIYAQGFDALSPNSVAERIMNADYTLMSQPWSRNFVNTQAHRALNPDDLQKLTISQLKDKAAGLGVHIKSKARKSDIISSLVEESGKSTSSFDFAGMRDYAVEMGLGKWKDEESEHTADNFELINNELEKIDENSNKSDKVFRGWNDTLKNVLGTLTAIGSIAGITKAFEVAYTASEQGTVAAGTTLDRRRGFVGMSALDELAAQTASKSIGLGQNAITNEIINLSNSREKYKLLGEGLNALFPSLTGIFDNIMSSDNPMDVYKGILKEVYANLQGADDNTKAQTLMLLESQGLGSAAQIIGSLLSNPKLAAELGNDPTALFNLKNNNYYGSFQTAEAILPEIEKLNASLSASYATLYTDWEKAFGLPFKTWWDDVLQNKVIPWFEKIIEFTGFGKSDAWKAVDQLAGEVAVAVGLPGMGGAIDERNKLIENLSANAQYRGYKSQTFSVKGVNLGNERWNAILSGNLVGKKGKVARANWDLFNEVLDISEEELKAKGATTALGTRQRVEYMINKYKETGLSAFLENTKNEDVDAYLLQALQMGAAGGKGWQETFDAYIDKVLKIGLEGKKDDEILAALREIAKNTEQKEELFKKEELWAIIEATYGTTVATAWKASLNRQ